MLKRIDGAQIEHEKLQKILSEKQAKLRGIKASIREMQTTLEMKRQGCLVGVDDGGQLMAERMILSAVCSQRAHQNELLKIRCSDIKMRNEQLSHDVGQYQKQQVVGNDVSGQVFKMKISLNEIRARNKLKIKELDSLLTSIISQRQLQQRLLIWESQSKDRTILTNDRLSTAKERLSSTEFINCDNFQADSMLNSSDTTCHSKDTTRMTITELSEEKTKEKEALKKSAGITKFKYANLLADSQKRNSELKSQINKLQAEISSQTAVKNAKNEQLNFDDSMLWIDSELTQVNREIALKEGQLERLKAEFKHKEQKAMEKLLEERDMLLGHKTTVEREKARLSDRFEQLNQKVTEFEIQTSIQNTVTQNTLETNQKLNTKLASLERSVLEKEHLLSTLNAQTVKLELASQRLLTD